MADLTAAVIGASGRMGQEHVKAYEACGVELVSMGSFPLPNIISIASPDTSHSNYVFAGLLMDSHIFCEKPLATEDYGLGAIKLRTERIPPGHIAQNFPLRYQLAFTNIDIDSLGEIYRIDAAYNWGRTHKLFEGWRAIDRNYSLVMGGLIHMVDLVLWLTGLDMEVISAIGCNKSAPGFSNHDTVMVQCRLSNGGVCNLVVDGGTGVEVHNHQLRMHGTKRGVYRINTTKTDKQACIKEFVRDIREDKPPIRDFRATEICLNIEKIVKS